MNSTITESKLFKARSCTLIGIAANVVVAVLMVIGFVRVASQGGVIWILVIVAGREIGRIAKVLYLSTKNLIANVTFFAMILAISFGLFIGLPSLLLTVAMLANLIAWDSWIMTQRMQGLPDSAEVRRIVLRHYAMLAAIVVLVMLSYAVISSATVTLSMWASIIIAAIVVLALVLLLRYLLDQVTSEQLPTL